MLLLVLGLTLATGAYPMTTSIGLMQISFGKFLVSLCLVFKLLVVRVLILKAFGLFLERLQIGCHSLELFCFGNETPAVFRKLFRLVLL